MTLKLKFRNSLNTPNWLAWVRFKRNKPALAGLIFIILMALLAIFAYEIIPDASNNANRQVLELKLKTPGFRVHLLKLRLNTPLQSKPVWRAFFSGQNELFRWVPYLDYHFQDDKLYITRYVGNDESGPEEYFLLADILFPLGQDKPVLSTGQIKGMDVFGQSFSIGLMEARNKIMNQNLLIKHFLLGTDALGRDYLSRLILGIRISLAVGLLAVIISMLIGVWMGSLAGYYKGKTDTAIMYIINVFWSFPTLLLALSLALVLKNGLVQVFLAIGLTMWIGVARIVRGQFLVIRELDYVKAARVLGLRNGQIIFRHILPNVSGPLIVVMASNFAAAILLEAGLSFLGLGVVRPTPSLGVMLNDHKSYLIAGLPHLALLPGIIISLLVLAFFSLGNGLRDAFDVKAVSSSAKKQ